MIRYKVSILYKLNGHASCVLRSCAYSLCTWRGGGTIAWHIIICAPANTPDDVVVQRCIMNSLKVPIDFSSLCCGRSASGRGGDGGRGGHDGRTHDDIKYKVRDPRAIARTRNVQRTRALRRCVARTHACVCTRAHTRIMMHII